MLDVQYAADGSTACAAGIVVRSLGSGSDTVVSEHQTVINEIADYRPGEFYLRELPAILPLAQTLVQHHGVATLAVDGYVDLAEARPGLGRHLYESLGGAIRVVGIAKNYFVGTTAIPVHRGRSRRPLWVSATHDVEGAAREVADMAGAYRVPELVRHVDHLARAGLSRL